MTARYLHDIAAAREPHPSSLRSFEPLARQRLEPAVYDFFAGGADDEVTLRDNETAFARLTLRPRVLRAAAAVPDLTTTLLGSELTMPVYVAPTAFHKLAHPDGEPATARAVAAAGSLMVVSMAATVPVEEVQAPHRWFQLYLQPDLGFTQHVVQRAEKAGCTALVVTVDSPVLGHRERDLRNGFTELPDGLCCENLRDPASGEIRRIEFEPRLGWEQLDWLRTATNLPIVLKGVLHPDDARLAAGLGVDALIVSNHGGRQLDTVPAAIDALPAVVDAVDRRLPVLMDGGVRRGTDVVKALALGATAVGLGRPVLWGLAAFGEEGVARVLAMIRAELEAALTLCGYGSPDQLPRDLVGRQPC
jgi:4-hydroxymandelate oxidase